MTAQPGAIDQEPRGTRRRAIVPLAIFGVLLVLVVAVLVLANRSGDTGLPPVPAEFEAPAPAEPMFVGTVRQASDGELSFGEDEDFAIPDGAEIELLRPASLDDIAEGDVVTAVGVPNDVRSFVVRYIVVFPGATFETGEFPRTAGGFRGHEPGPDGNEVPALAGQVTGVEEGAILLNDGNGELRLELTGEQQPPSGTVRVVETGSIDDIGSGARVAIPAEDGDPVSGADAVIVYLSADN